LFCFSVELQTCRLAFNLTRSVRHDQKKIVNFNSFPKVTLKVPEREIFDRSDFPDFYTIKSSWVGDLVVKY
jgi:hypothetical protein